MTKKERNSIWVKVVQILEDTDLSKVSNIHRVIETLDKQYSLKEKKFKPKREEVD